MQSNSLCFLCEKTVSVLFEQRGPKKKYLLRKLKAVMRGSAGCLLDVEFRRNSTSGGVTYTRKHDNIHTPQSFSEKGRSKTFILWGWPAWVTTIKLSSCILHLMPRAASMTRSAQLIGFIAATPIVMLVLARMLGKGKKKR